MSDLRCDDCGNRLDWRLLPDGSIATLCGDCSEHYGQTVPESEAQRYEHLTRAIEGIVQKIIISPFECPLCGASGEKLKRNTRKTNECLSCDATYPIYD